MKRFFRSLAAVMVAVVIVFGYVPAIEVHADDRSGESRVSIATSGGHWAKLVDGDLWLWGLNIFGQIGDGSTSIRHYDPVHVMENVTAISLGLGHTMAIGIDGSLWAWGSNYHGQLGDGTTIDRHKPVRIMENVTAVSAGPRYTMAIRSDGSLWAWVLMGSGNLVMALPLPVQSLCK